MQFRSFLPAAALLVASLSFSSAFASPITGYGSIAGADTYTYTATPTRYASITFNPTSGIFYNGTGTMAAFNNSTATLTSFNTNNAVGTNVFSVSNSGKTLDFTISSLASFGYNPNTMTLSFAGSGLFTETGYDPTPGTFSLSTSTTGNGTDSVTSFQLNGITSTAVTPEPSSLILLGTGLVGAATTALRRRKLMA